MREITSHTAGRVFLGVLGLSIVAMLGMIGAGVMERTVLLFGWITMPLLAGSVFVLVWLVAYLVYFFLYWPYR